MNYIPSSIASFWFNSAPLKNGFPATLNKHLRVGGQISWSTEITHFKSETYIAFFTLAETYEFSYTAAQPRNTLCSGPEKPPET